MKLMPFKLSITFLLLMNFHNAISQHLYNSDLILKDESKIDGNENSRNYLRKIEINPIYSISSFNWSIAGNNNYPNILSELKWQRLLSYGLETTFSFQINKIIRPSLTWTIEKNYMSKATDTDYGENNRNEILYYKEFIRTNGFYSRISLLNPINSNNNFLVGLSSSIQHLNMYHENIEDHSLYNARWIGLEGKSFFTLYKNKSISILTINNIRLSKYFGKADWVLREDLMHPVSFKHYTYLGELQNSLQILFALKNKISLGFGGNYLFQKSLKGDDVLFFSTGEVALTRLNGINGRRASGNMKLTLKL